jgi:membrane protein YqaA with SNARE-associated domain
MYAILLVFLIVLALNVLPAFAPPTWMVFSFAGFRFPEHANWLLALTGALAATLGRCVLAKMSRLIVRQRWLSETSRDNVDTLRDELLKRPRLTFSVLFFYAFTPLPSNTVFIAYGLTTMNMLRIAVPFFLGRFVSYSFWARGAKLLSRKFDVDNSDALGYFSVYFVLTQLAFLGIVFLFARIDRRALIHEREWKWLREQSALPPKVK